MTSFAGRLNTLYPASLIDFSLSARVLSRIGSTEWMRNGSMIVWYSISEMVVVDNRIDTGHYFMLNSHEPTGDAASAMLFVPARIVNEYQRHLLVTL